MLTNSKVWGWWLIIILNLFIPSAKALVLKTNEDLMARSETTKQSLQSVRDCFATLAMTVKRDYLTYYSLQGLKQPLAGLAISGITANAEFDFLFRNSWQRNMRSNTTDHIADFIDDYSDLTQYYYSIPVYILSQLLPNHTLQQWGNHSLRILALGAPQQAILTSLLGSSRPSEDKPQWHPFQYHRGVSGHAFYGAVPFLALAALEERSYLKYTYTMLSTLPGFARINNDKHYYTQAFLGWWLAYCASVTIQQSNPIKLPQNTSLHLIPQENGIYLAGTIHF